MDGIKFSGHGDLAGVINLYPTCEKISLWISGDAEGARDGDTDSGIQEETDTKEKKQKAKWESYSEESHRQNSMTGRQRLERGKARKIKTHARWRTNRVGKTGSINKQMTRRVENRQSKIPGWSLTEIDMREIKTKRELETDRGSDTWPSHSYNGSSYGAQLSRRAVGIRNVECETLNPEEIATVCV